MGRGCRRVRVESGAQCNWGELGESSAPAEPYARQRAHASRPPGTASRLEAQGGFLFFLLRAEDFAAGHLRDAKNIPLADLGNRIGELEKSKTRTIVVVCQSGARADKAAKVLGAAGFTDVFSLDGGQPAWVTAGLPITK